MSEEPKPEELYAAVLLPRSLRHVRYVSTKGKSGSERYIKDASLLPFLVEEIISNGAIHLAVDRESEYYTSIDFLPKVFQRRVWKIDQKLRMSSKIEAITGPMLSDLEKRHADLPKIGANLPSEAGLAAAALKRFLRPFLLGLEYQLQVDLRLDSLRKHIGTLDRDLSDSTARAHLAMLKQVFGAYERLEVKELEFSPASTAQRAEAFQRFVEDANYQQLSAQRRLLGFPTMVERAIIRVDRLADMLIGSSPFRHLLSLGTKSIEAATRIPLPDAKAFESFTSEGYLPPIISLEEQIARAESAWKKARPALIPVFDDPKEKDSAGELVDVDSD